MDIFFTLLFLCIGYQLLILWLGIIVQLTGYLLGLFLVFAIEFWNKFWTGCWLLVKFLGEALASLCIWTGNHVWAVLIFSYFLTIESLHGEPSNPGNHDQEAEDDNSFEDEEEEENRPNKVYLEALALLGLQEGCTQKMLNLAFRKAMERAHPDKGGSHEKALAVNAARNIIKTQNGWR